MSAVARTGRRRAVILVPNAANPYSRALRIARSLVGAGYDVEIAAVDEPGASRNERDREVVIRRYVPTPETRVASWPAIRQARQVLLWPEGDRGWYRTLRRELPPADLYHACGHRAIGVALDLAAAARGAGRAGRVVYDVIDVQLDSQVYNHLPGAVRAIHRVRERRWIRAADAVVTVNQAIADHLGRSWGLVEPVTVLLNCQPRWTPPAARPNHLRAAAGIPAERSVVLFLGKLAAGRGLDEAAEAVLRLPDAAFVLMGFGPWTERMLARDRDPRFAGRHFTIPPVHPDDVPAWTASADVSIVPAPPDSLNQRLSTPNKFWESLTAGTPVVVSRGLEVMAAILARDDLGASAAGSDATALATALAAIVDRPAGARAAMRDRCRRVTRERYNWETTVEPYLALVQRLVGLPA